MSNVCQRTSWLHIATHTHEIVKNHLMTGRSKESGPMMPFLLFVIRVGSCQYMVLQFWSRLRCGNGLGIMTTRMMTIMMDVNSSMMACRLIGQGAFSSIPVTDVIVAVLMNMYMTWFVDRSWCPRSLHVLIAPSHQFVSCLVQGFVPVMIDIQCLMNQFLYPPNLPFG